MSLLQEFLGDGRVFSIAGRQTPTYREKVADSKLYVVNQKGCQFERDALEVLIHSVADVRDLLVIEFFFVDYIRSWILSDEGRSSVT